MILVISWSGIASAVQKPIHCMMMFQTSMLQENSAKTHQDIPFLKTSSENNCHDTMSIEHDSLMHCDLMANETLNECNDCTLWHCQANAFSLDVYHPQLSTLSVHEALDTANSIYKKQYLKGHWQKVIRPPKA